MRYDEEPAFSAPLPGIGQFDLRPGAPAGTVGADTPDAALERLPEPARERERHSLTTPVVTTDDAMAWHAIAVDQNTEGSAGVHAQSKLYDGQMPFTGTGGIGWSPHDGEPVRG